MDDQNLRFTYRRGIPEKCLSLNEELPSGIQFLDEKQVGLTRKRKCIGSDVWCDTETGHMLTAQGNTVRNSDIRPGKNGIVSSTVYISREPDISAYIEDATASPGTNSTSVTGSSFSAVGPNSTGPSGSNSPSDKSSSKPRGILQKKLNTFNQEKLVKDIFFTNARKEIIQRGLTGMAGETKFYSKESENIGPLRLTMGICVEEAEGAKHLKFETRGKHSEWQETEWRTRDRFKVEIPTICNSAGSDAQPMQDKDGLKNQFKLEKGQDRPLRTTLMSKTCLL